MVENFPNKKDFLKLSSFYPPQNKGIQDRILLLFIYLFIYFPAFAWNFTQKYRLELGLVENKENHLICHW
jgi:hypothetical protein